MRKGKTYKLKKMNEEQLYSLLKNILNDFLEYQNPMSAIDEIKETVPKKWVVDVKYFAFDSENPYLEESFYFNTKKEAIEFTKN